MKICAIGLRGLPNVMGGIETHCEQLYTELSPHVDEIVILARSPYINKQFHFKSNISVIPIFTFKNKFIETFLHTFISILYARILLKPDIVHLHAIGPSIFTPIARLLGLKVVVTHHGADYNRQKWNKFAKSLLRFGESMAVKHASQILVVGSSLSQHLKKKFPLNAKKIHYIPNGCPQVVSEEVASTLTLPEDLKLEGKHYILFVGRLVPEKGVHDLINAFVEANLPNTVLLIVGGVDFEDSYSKGLMSKANGNIVFAGKRHGKDLWAIYKFSSLVVLPSYHEGLPIVALEALSFNIPLLLSDIEPNLDLELDPTNYFGVGDIKDLSYKLTHKPESLTSNQQILSKFSWPNIAQATLKIYQKCLV